MWFQDSGIQASACARKLRLRLLLLVSTAIELGLRYHVLDLPSKFEENRTKTAVAIANERWCGQTNRHAHRQAYTQVIYIVQCHPVSSMSARRDLLLLAIAYLLLPARDSGTVYLSTSSLPRHSQHFVVNWKLIYFGNHIQTVFFNCFVIVVLEVSFT